MLVIASYLYSPSLELNSFIKDIGIVPCRVGLKRERAVWYTAFYARGGELRGERGDVITS